jgi:hypothetical protein
MGTLLGDSLPRVGGTRQGAITCQNRPSAYLAAAVLSSSTRGEIGAGDGTRTRDSLLGRKAHAWIGAARDGLARLAPGGGKTLPGRVRPPRAARVRGSLAKIVAKKWTCTTCARRPVRLSPVIRIAGLQPCLMVARSVRCGRSPAHGTADWPDISTPFQHPIGGCGRRIAPNHDAGLHGLVPLIPYG